MNLTKVRFFLNGKVEVYQVPPEKILRILDIIEETEVQDRGEFVKEALPLIIETVKKLTSIDPVDKSRKKRIVAVRHITIDLCRKYTKAYLEEIGKALDYLDHSSISHAIKSVANMKETKYQLKGPDRVLGFRDFNEIYSKIDLRVSRALSKYDNSLTLKHKK